MMFLFSMLLTTCIGFLICFRNSQHLTFIETLFISIFLGWGYFTSLVLLFSTKLPEVELSGDLLFALIVISLFVFSIPAVIIHGIKVIHFFKSIPGLMKQFISNHSSIKSFGLKSRYYLILPSVFLILFIFYNVLLAIFSEIQEVDPIFEWLQRGELIFLEKSVTGVSTHPIYFFPMHIPILYSWAYFFDFDAIRIYFLIALIGFTFITMENIFIFTKSRYASVLLTIMIVYAQQIYTESGYAEGLTNIYFFLAALYGIRYFQQNKITFILLSSFFMTMYVNTRSEGILYWGLLMVIILLISVLNKKFKIIHIIYWFSPLLLFNYIPNLNVLTSGELNLVMNAKIITKCLLDMFDIFGEIYKNKEPYWEAIFPGETSLIRGYHGNKFTCMIVSIFAFWDSLLFDPYKIHVYNVINTLIVLIKHIRVEIYLLLLLVLWKEFRSSDTMKKFALLVVFPIVGFTIIINFLQIYIFYSPNTLLTVVGIAAVRYGGMITICIIFFLSSNNSTMTLFKKIERNNWLAYTLNIPFLYLLIEPVYNYFL